MYITVISWLLPRILALSRIYIKIIKISGAKPSGLMTNIIKNRSSTPAALSTSSTSTCQFSSTSTSGANTVTTIPIYIIYVGAH